MMFGSTNYLVIGVVCILAYGVVRVAWVRYGDRRRMNQWVPDLSADRDGNAVHVLGAPYPQRTNTFMEGFTRRTYSVPKDPEAYAKIFVPTETKEGPGHDRR
jgi:hypothetical protein